MPARNRTKIYIENGYYHIYNRGVEKRRIFLDKQDYAVFLSYLKNYLTPKDEAGLLRIISDINVSYKEKSNALKLLRLNNFFGEITLLAYCLMPNHFHLFIKQKNPQSIDKFMQSLATRYTMYFNRKHKRVGFLYQDIYKAVLIDHEEQFIYLSKYIHKQALIHLATKGPTLQDWEGQQPSSIKNYLGQKKSEWVNTKEILTYFSKTNPNLSYESFLSDSDDYSIIQNKLLE